MGGEGTSGTANLGGRGQEAAKMYILNKKKVLLPSNFKSICHIQGNSIKL
jgi:hypothetical protein